jgi:hypothetical protein
MVTAVNLPTYDRRTISRFLRLGIVLEAVLFMGFAVASLPRNIRHCEGEDFVVTRGLVLPPAWSTLPSEPLSAAFGVESHMSGPTPGATALDQLYVVAGTSDLLTRPMAARGKSHLSRAPTTPNV